MQFMYEYFQDFEKHQKQMRLITFDQLCFVMLPPVGKNRELSTQGSLVRLLSMRILKYS